jgi:hypothetical protein
LDSALILPPVLKPDFGFTEAVLGAQKKQPLGIYERRFKVQWRRG